MLSRGRARHADLAEKGHRLAEPDGLRYRLRARFETKRGRHELRLFHRDLRDGTAARACRGKGIEHLGAPIKHADTVRAERLMA